MVNSTMIKRGLLSWSNSPRFCFFLLFCPAVSLSQTDSSFTVTTSVGTEYFDIFRQRSDRIRTTALSKESFALISASVNNDSLWLRYHSIENYASFNQISSRFNSSLKYSLKTIVLGYAGSFYFFDYSLMLGVPLKTLSHPAMYCAGVFASPFGSILTIGVELERSPFQYNSAILFQDFFVPLHDVAQTTSISYAIRSRPFDDMNAAILFYESEGSKNADPNGFATTARQRMFGKNISLQYVVSRSTFLRVEIGTEELRTDLILKQNDQSFGDLSNGSGKHSSYSATLQTETMSLPVSVEYSFDQLILAGAGHVESWPFTTLASSIIANRLNYQLSGFIKHHSFKTKANLNFVSSVLSATVSYNRILPDAVLEHWEPEFLVFGMKNFTRDPFSIKDCHLMGIGVHYNFPIQRINISAFVEQCVPLSIAYRKHEPLSAPVQQVPASGESRPVTDGGRRFGLTCLIKI